MNVFWLQQNESDVPAENGWLTPGELLRMEEMRFLKRRRDYRLGRWTAKRAVAAYLGWPVHSHVLAKIDIGIALTGAPIARVNGEFAPVAISISHRRGVAMCAVAHSGVALGCDLELIEPRSPAFVSDYFAPEEGETLDRVSEAARVSLATLLWSAKESALKALQEGLRLDTRSVIVCPVDPAGQLNNNLNSARDIGSGSQDDSWYPFHVRCTSGLYFQGWSQYAAEFVRTIVRTPPLLQPISLQPWLNDELLDENKTTVRDPMTIARAKHSQVFRPTNTGNT